MRNIRKILIGQSGGPTVAINSSLAGIIARAHEEGIEIYGMQNGIEGFLSGRYTNLTNLFFPQENQQNRSVDQQEHGVDQHGADQQKRTVELLAKTPSSFLGSCRYKLPEVSEKTSFYQDIEYRLTSLGIDGILYIGGNDSMDTVNKLAAYFAQHNNEVSVIGIPKTIDNDLEGTDHTPGFGSAARFVASVTAELTRDGGVYNTKNVTFIEAMGRDAGWLTAAGALAQDICGTAPDFVLLPEVSLDENTLLSTIEQRLREKNNVIVVVSEGVHHADGSFLFDAKSVAIDTFGHLAAQSGTAAYLSQLAKNQLGVKSRGIELNTLQRCASHAASKVDLDEAEALGAAGVEAVLQGKTGVMVGVHRILNEPYTTEIRTTPVADVANKVKLVPQEMITDDGFNVTDAALTYLRPLVAGMEESVSVDGLPRFFAELP